MSTKISIEQFMHHVNLIVAEKTKTMLTGITMDAGHSMTRQARHRVRTLGRGKIGDTYLDQSTKVTWTCVEVEGPEIGDLVYGMWTTWEANTLDNNVPTPVDPSFDAKLREIDPTIKKRLTEKELYALIFVFMWGRWTLPRFRIDQLLGFSWKVLIPVSLVSLVVTAFVLMVVRP